jgi:hypothetical protein
VSRCRCASRFDHRLELVLQGASDASGLRDVQADPDVLHAPCPVVVHRPPVFAPRDSMRRCVSWGRADRSGLPAARHLPRPRDFRLWAAFAGPPYGLDMTPTDVAARAVEGGSGQSRPRIEAVAVDGTLLEEACRPGPQVPELLDALTGAAIDLVVLGDDGADVLRSLGLSACGPGRVLAAAGDGGWWLSPSGTCVARSTEGPHPVGSIAWALRALAERGIGPGLVLLVVAAGRSLVDVEGIERCSVRRVGADRREDLASELDAQLMRRRHGAVPDIDRDRGWLLDWLEPFEPGSHEVVLAALSDGNIGVVGDLEDDGDALVLVAGAYGIGRDGGVRPLPGPVPVPVALTSRTVGEEGIAWRRVLDLRSGLLRYESDDGARSAAGFVSLVTPGLLAQRMCHPSPAHRWPTIQLAPPANATAMLGASFRFEHHGRHDPEVASTMSDRAVVSAAATTQHWIGTTSSQFERVVVTRAGGRARTPTPALDLEQVTRRGFDVELRAHRAAWAGRWADADIEIDGDPETQRAVRFSLFHLLSSAATAGEATVGARGLTGLGYAGHVFWDTDVFVLPALAAVAPAAARAVLEYRVRRLRAARALARSRGAPGVRFPWESADSGDDVTPCSVRGLDGRTVEIHTGDAEEHLNACIAWAAVHYARWSGDHRFLQGSGRALVVETARYWAWRIERDGEGHAHIRGVIGPDEYHVGVDDNAFTNGMVRWHLRRAATLVAEDEPATAVRWRSLADALVDGYDPASGTHEQFAGFWDLEPLIISELAAPPVAAHALLGEARVAGSQVIKQPDVLMLHHLVAEAMPHGSLAADVATYLPRTAHGSSLSPAICASLLARAGRPDDAMPLFELALRLDLDDRTGTTAEGLHLATMGGVWQCLVHGFAGIRATEDSLIVDPRLPRRWRAVRVRVRYRNRPLQIAIDHSGVRVEGGDGLPILVAPAGAASAMGARAGRGSP